MGLKAISVSKKLKCLPLGMLQGVGAFFFAHTDALKCPQVLGDPPIPPLPIKREVFEILKPKFKYLAQKFKYLAPKFKHMAPKFRYTAPKFK